MMKRVTIIAAMLLSMTALHAQEFEGLEKGDKEVSFFGMVMAGKFFSIGYISVSGGYYFTDKLMAGAAPGLIIAPGATDFNIAFFGTYNFFTDRRAFPYVKASLTQQSFRTYGGGASAFFANMSLQGGGGYKVFFTERLAWDTNATLGINFGSPVGVRFTLLTGLSFTF
jgi:hypothetical protein